MVKIPIALKLWQQINFLNHNLTVLLTQNDDIFTAISDQIVPIIRLSRGAKPNKNMMVNDSITGVLAVKILN